MCSFQVYFTHKYSINTINSSTLGINLNDDYTILWIYFRNHIISSYCHYFFKKPCTHCLLVFISSYWSQLIHSLVLWLCQTFHKKGHLKYRLFFSHYMLHKWMLFICSFVDFVFFFFLKQGLRFTSNIGDQTKIFTHAQNTD